MLYSMPKEQLWKRLKVLQQDVRRIRVRFIVAAMYGYRPPEIKQAPELPITPIRFNMENSVYVQRTAKQQGQGDYPQLALERCEYKELLDSFAALSQHGELQIATQDHLYRLTAGQVCASLHCI